MIEYYKYTHITRFGAIMSRNIRYIFESDLVWLGVFICIVTGLTLMWEGGNLIFIKAFKFGVSIRNK